MKNVKKLKTKLIINQLNKSQLKPMIFMYLKKKKNMDGFEK